MLFYSDLRELLLEIDSSYLPHLLILKWAVISSFSYLIFRMLSKLSFSQKTLFRVISGSKDAKPELKEKIIEIEDTQEIREDLKKYRDIHKFPKLKSEIDEILK